jgi:uncharacterized RDD family membrane protein YckC
MENLPKTANSLENAAKPGLLRIFASIFYDIWLIAAIWLLGTTLDTFIRQAAQLPAGEGNFMLLQVWFVLSPLLFYGWFWTHGGQTLGMRAWRIKVVDGNGGPIDWKRSVIRYFAALLSWLPAGLGFIWILFDRDNCSWHDRLSGSYLVMTEKRRKPKA